MNLEDLLDLVTKLKAKFGGDSLVDVFRRTPNGEMTYFDLNWQWIVDPAGPIAEKPWRNPHPENWISLEIVPV